MRDLVAIVIAIGLVIFALRMATSLQWYRRSHSQRRRNIERAGQTIVAEIPSREGLEFFTEDAAAFFWLDQRIPKAEIRSVRMLTSGAPLVARVARRFSTPARDDAVDLDGDPEAFERDRWNVEIGLKRDIVSVECGAIRERVSQELARQVFDVIKADIDARDIGKARHVGEVTIPAQPHRGGD